MDNMQVFSYDDNEPKKLRVIVVEGAPWLLLCDLNKILRMSNTTQLARNLPESERRYAWLCEPNSRLEYIVISEKALHTILKRYASKPGINRVAEWIRRDVLPHITRKGGFPASILHKEYESSNLRRRCNPSADTREEKFVIPVTKVSEAKPKDGPDLSFVLWEVEMFLRVARMNGITDKQRMWAIDNALREVRKKKTLGSTEDKIMKLPEVVGQVNHRRKKNLDANDWIVVNPVSVIAECVELTSAKVNAFAEAKGMKRNGVDGFWMDINGTAREFMYTNETMDLLIKSAAQIHLFNSDEAA